MARDGNGDYTLPSNTTSPATSGTTIDSSDFNETMDDIETALDESVFTAGTSGTDNVVIRADGTSGKKVQESGVSIDDSNNVSGIVNLTQTGYIDISEIATPANPAANVARIYSADDGGTTKLYFRDSAGTETEVGAGGGGNTFADNVFRVQDNGDATKQIAFEASGITTGTTRTLTVPDSDLTIAGTATTQTLTNKTIDGDNNTISNLDLGNEVDWAAATDVADATAVASGDKFLIFEAGVGLRKIDYDDLPGAGGGISSLLQDTTPQLGGMLDVNTNAIGDGTRELITFTEDASAVNHINIENEATGSGPIIRAAGDDTNVDLNFQGKGTGNISLGNFVFDVDQTVGAGQDNYVLTYDNGSGLISLEASAGGGGGNEFADNVFRIQDNADATKEIAFEASGITTGTTRTLTVPDADLTIVGTATTQTLTNKTLTSAVLNTGVSGTAVLDEDTMSSNSATQLATQQSIKAYVDNTALYQGTHTIVVPASAMTPRATNGAAIVSSELATNDIALTTADFDTATEEGVGFHLPMPKSWDEGTVKFIPYWTAASGSGGVVWQMQAVALGDNDALDSALGTGQTSTDTFITANDCHVGDPSNDITIAGTPAPNDLVYFEITREVANGSDTLGVDAKLIAVKILFTIDAGDDT